MYAYIKHNGKAIDTLRRCTQLMPEFPNSYNILGIVYQNTGEMEKAITNYKKAIELDPNFIDAHYHLGLAFLETGNVRGAAEQYRLLAKLDQQKANKIKNMITSEGK